MRLMPSRDREGFGLRRPEPRRTGRPNPRRRRVFRHSCGLSGRGVLLQALGRPAPHRAPGRAGLGRDLSTVRLRRRFGATGALDPADPR